MAQAVPAMATSEGLVQGSQEPTASALSLQDSAKTVAAKPEINLSKAVTPVPSVAQSETIFQSKPVILADQSTAPTPSVSELTSKTNSSIGQVTSVSQLSDVQPTDWAFQALQSLVERYGCIAGYPDGTFRGNRAATRYELAAALNACLDQLSNRFATKEDLATIKALQDEFAAELATLRGRVDALEARTATLEAQQFSTTTKLQGEAVLAFQYGRTDGTGFGNLANGAGPIGPDDSNPTAIGRVRLNFNTSFNGDDLLQTQLEAGNNGEDLFSNVLAGTPLTTADGAYGAIDRGAVDYALVPQQFNLRRLAYTFKPFKDFAFTVGPRLFPSDFVDFNSYANNSAQDFSSGFFINNPLIIANPVDGPGGAGAAFDYNPGSGPFSIRATYVAANGFNAIGGGGLGGRSNQATGEIEFADTFGASGRNNFALRLQFTRTENTFFDADVAGANAEVTFGRFGLFGRFGYAFDYDPTGPGQGGAQDVYTWMAGVGIRDLFLPGSLLAAAVGQPFVGPNQSFFGNNSQVNYEGFYRFAVNDNISITPTVMVITDANNNGGNPTVFQGLLRTTFSF
jgi:hypothetical protein